MMKYDISNTNVRIGRFVRDNRRKLNMSAGELAVKLDICQQHMSRFERGQCAFTVEFTLRILNVFNKKMSHFVCEVFHEDTQALIMAHYSTQRN